VATSYQAGCDDHKYHAVHVVHNVLFSLTIIILGTFEVGLLTMMYLLGLITSLQKFYTFWIFS
jgi:hypothetical protein